MRLSRHEIPALSAVEQHAILRIPNRCEPQNCTPWAASFLRRSDCHGSPTRNADGLVGTWDLSTQTGLWEAAEVRFWVRGRLLRNLSAMARFCLNRLLADPNALAKNVATLGRSNP